LPAIILPHEYFATRLIRLQSSALNSGRNEIDGLWTKAKTGNPYLGNCFLHLHETRQD